MKNAMQLKVIVKNIAKEKKISAQLVLQNYMPERFLERVSLSRYRDNYIIKGFLIASMVGLDSGAKMDMAVFGSCMWLIAMAVGVFGIRWYMCKKL